MGRFRGEQGQTAAEFAGTLVVVAALVLAVATAGIGSAVGNGVEQSVCRILGQASCPGPVAAEPPGPTLDERLQAAGNPPLSTYECEILRSQYGLLNACTPPRKPGPLTDQEIRDLSIAFTGETGEFNQLLCGVDVLFADGEQLTQACRVLRDVSGTTTGDQAVVSLGNGLREVIRRQREFLPFADELYRAMEIADGHTVDGEPLTDEQRFRNVLAIAASILPADEVADLARIARSGAADDVAEHIQGALSQVRRGGDELETAVERGDAFLEGRALWSTGPQGSASHNAYRHYRDHGTGVGAANSVDYVRRAHDFLRHPPPGTQTRYRSNGDVVRYDPATGHFGVMTADGTPRTYFVPDPALHRHPTNQAYFEAQGALQPPP